MFRSSIPSVPARRADFPASPRALKKAKISPLPLPPLAPSRGLPPLPSPESQRPKPQKPNPGPKTISHGNSSRPSTQSAAPPRSTTGYRTSPKREPCRSGTPPPTPRQQHKEEKRNPRARFQFRVQRQQKRTRAPAPGQRQQQIKKPNSSSSSSQSPKSGEWVSAWSAIRKNPGFSAIYAVIAAFVIRWLKGQNISIASTAVKYIAWKSIWSSLRRQNSRLQPPYPQPQSRSANIQNKSISMSHQLAVLAGPPHDWPVVARIRLYSSPPPPPPSPPFPASSPTPPSIPPPPPAYSPRYAVRTSSMLATSCAGPSSRTRPSAMT